MRDIDRLLEQYKPLILSIYKKRNHYFRNKQDHEDFLSQLYLIFTHLVYEYNPNRGVDFPYYIQRMMEFRAGHYIAKYNKRQSRETVIEPDSLQYHQDRLQQEEIERLGELVHTLLSEEMSDVLGVESWDDAGLILGKKQEQLFLGIIRDNKTPRQLADEEGVNISTIHTRIHFLTKKIREHFDETNETRIFEQNPQEL